MSIERRRVFYSGHVQGVGFRATSLRLAEGRPVAGFVRNLPDGRVELLVEGTADAIDNYLAAVRSELGGRIRSESSQPEPPSDPPLDEFLIDY